MFSWKRGRGIKGILVHGIHPALVFALFALHGLLVKAPAGNINDDSDNGGDEGDDADDDGWR